MFGSKSLLEDCDWLSRSGPGADCVFGAVVPFRCCCACSVMRYWSKTATEITSGQHTLLAEPLSLPVLPLPVPRWSMTSRTTTSLWSTAAVSRQQQQADRQQGRGQPAPHGACTQLQWHTAPKHAGGWLATVMLVRALAAAERLLPCMYPCALGFTNLLR
jgi:hypothetical protein